VGRRRFGANGELGMRSYAATRRRTRTLFVIQSIPFNVKPAEVIRAAKELELEGLIAKRNGSIYEPLTPHALGCATYSCAQAPTISQLLTSLDPTGSQRVGLICGTRRM